MTPEHHELFETIHNHLAEQLKNYPHLCIELQGPINRKIILIKGNRYYAHHYFKEDHLLIIVRRYGRIECPEATIDELYREIHHYNNPNFLQELNNTLPQIL